MNDKPKKTRRPDPRLAQTRKAVLEATFELVGELGFSGATIEKIAERSDIARSTIYRHWPDPSRLYIEAFAPMSETGVSLTGDTLVDLKGWLDHAVERFRKRSFVAALAALIDQTTREDEYASLHRDFMGQRIEVVKKIVQDGAAQGVVRPDADPDLVVEKLLSPLIYTRLILHSEISDELAARILDEITAYLHLPQA